MRKEVWRYGGYSYPKPPDWTKNYAYLAIHGYGLDKNYSRIRYLFAFNSWSFTSGSNATYGTWHNTVVANGKRCKYQNGAWGSAVSAGGEYLYDEYPYNTTEEGTIWSSVDIPCVNDAGEERIVIKGSAPYYFMIGYDWTDFGQDAADDTVDDISNESSMLNGDLYYGWSVAGAFRCIASASDSEAFTFEWYMNGVLAHTDTGVTKSTFRPRSNQLGTDNYYCRVTSGTGNTLTTDTFTRNVVEYDSGSGDDSGEGEKESYVSGIPLDVSKDTVFPGEQVTIVVTVEGVGNYSKAFTTAVSGNNATGTTLTVNGRVCTLTIGADETADSILFTVEASGVSESAVILVRHDTPERLQAAFLKGYAAAKALQGGDQ